MGVSEPIMRTECASVTEGRDVHAFGVPPAECILGARVMVAWQYTPQTNAFLPVRNTTASCNADQFTAGSGFKVAGSSR